MDNSSDYRRRPSSAFWSGGGCRGERPAKTYAEQTPAQTVFAVEWSGRRRGADGTSASRWRQRNGTAKMPEVKGEASKIFQPQAF